VHARPPAQPPQSSKPPQPSPIRPHASGPRRLQVIGTQNVPHALGALSEYGA
jgi:hypothetical protein